MADRVEVGFGSKGFEDEGTLVIAGASQLKGTPGFVEDDQTFGAEDAEVEVVVIRVPLGDAPTRIDAGGDALVEGDEEDERRRRP